MTSSVWSWNLIHMVVLDTSRERLTREQLNADNSSLNPISLPSLCPSFPRFPLISCSLSPGHPLVVATRSRKLHPKENMQYDPKSNESTPLDGGVCRGGTREY
jgi:hypothetical protein